VLKSGARPADSQGVSISPVPGSTPWNVWSKTRTSSGAAGASNDWWAKTSESSTLDALTDPLDRLSSSAGLAPTALGQSDSPFYLNQVAMFDAFGEDGSDSDDSDGAGDTLFQGISAKYANLLGDLGAGSDQADGFDFLA
jgi:hypothetical protein